MLTFLQTALNRAWDASQPRDRQLFWPLLFLLLLGGGFAARSLFAPAPLTVDEGVHLVWAKLLAEGYAPYTETYLPVPPLWPLLLEIIWGLWPTVTALQLVLLLIWAAGIVAMALLAYETSGQSKAGLGAAFLFTFSEMYFRDSQPILMEMPCIVAAIFATWLALRYRNRGERWALIGSALLAAVSLGLKLLLPFLPLLILGIILSRDLSLKAGPAGLSWSERLRQPLAQATLWLAVFLLFPLLSLVWFDAQAMAQQMIGQRLEARQTYIEEEDYWASRFNRLGEYAANQRGLIVMGVLGLGLTFFQPLKARWWLFGWLGLAAAMLIFQTPIRYKHFILLSIPLAVSAGLLFAFASTRRSAGQSLALLGLLLGFGFFSLDFITHLDRWAAYAQEPDPPPNHLPALDFIAKVTTPQDCLISDYPQLLFWSDRLPPPELSELTSNRLRSGALTGSELITLNEVYDCPLVAPLTGRLERSANDYLEWVKTHYYGRFLYDEGSKVIYFGYPLAPEVVRQRAIPYNVTFGRLEREMELVAVNPLPSTVQAGDRIPVTLFWQALQPPTTEYTIFVQLRDSENNTVASADHEPYGSLLPFSRWPVGGIMPETSWLQLPPDLPAGDYTLFIGLYNPQTLDRLPVIADQSGENAVKLSLIKVQP